MALLIIERCRDEQAQDGLAKGCNLDMVHNNACISIGSESIMKYKSVAEPCKGLTYNDYKNALDQLNKIYRDAHKGDLRELLSHLRALKIQIGDNYPKHEAEYAKELPYAL
tara:strand:+ start:609 stop:941 length:333 start_codon:yes stop_codon:yes gene_type:complete